MIFFKPTIPPKMNEQIWLYYYDTSGRLVFVRFWEEIKDTKKNISKLTCIFVYFKINQNMSFMNYIQFWKHARMKLFLKIVIFVHILKSTLGFKDSVWWSCQKRIGPFQPMCIPYCTLSFAIDSCSGLLKFSFANSSMYTL